MANKYEEKVNESNERDFDEGNRNSSRRSKKRSKTFKTQKGKRMGREHGRSSNSVVDGRSTGNDFGWYNTLPELTKATSRFPFSRPLGTTLMISSQKDWVKKSLKKYNTGEVMNSIPGAMLIRWSPTVGSSVDSVSPLNTVSRQIYSFVRHANSGAANYDATDYMLYLLAMDSAYSMYVAGIRAYGLINMYNKQNRYMPKNLIEHLGFDFEDMKKNAAQFYKVLNQVAYKMSSWAVPNFMSYYLRHMWMNTGIYTDKDSPKAQMYAFVQDGVYIYDDKIESTTFAGLKYTRVPAKMTINDYSDFMDSIIRPMVASEDFGNMSGDTLKAFGPNNLFTIPPIPEDFVVVPAYNPEVLSQIQNLSIVGRSTGDVYGKIDTANPTVYYTSNIVQCIDGENLEGYLYCNPIFEQVTAASDPSGLSWIPLVDKLVTSDSEVPDEANVMVSTRLTNTPDVSIKHTDGKYYYAFDQDKTCSSEVVCEVRYFAFTNGEIQTHSIGSLGYYVDALTNVNLTYDLLAVPVQISKFDWNPTFPITARINEEDGAQFLGYFQDTNNYTVMTSIDLNNLHETALMSEFYIPQIAAGARKPISNK